MVENVSESENCSPPRDENERGGTSPPDGRAPLIQARRSIVTKPLLLIVDDDRADRFLLQRYIKKLPLDVDVMECVDGVLALEYFRGLPESNPQIPDLVLLDVRLPRKNGYEILADYEALLQQRPELATRFLVMRTHSSRADEEACSAFYFVVGTISKEPEHPDEFARTILNALGAK